VLEIVLVLGGTEEKSGIRKWNLTVNNKHSINSYEQPYADSHSQVLYHMPVAFPNKALLSVTPKRRKMNPLVNLQQPFVQLSSPTQILQPQPQPDILQYLIPPQQDIEQQPEITPTIQLSSGSLLAQLTNSCIDGINPEPVLRFLPRNLIKSNMVADIKKLLCEGSDVHAHVSDNKSTALHQAACHCGEEMIKLLFEYGAMLFQKLMAVGFPFITL